MQTGPAQPLLLQHLLVRAGLISLTPAMPARLHSLPFSYLQAKHIEKYFFFFFASLSQASKHLLYFGGVFCFFAIL